jgi:8-oxo-dGTP pyrophosphatase MutT (NUDIX family)
MDISVTITSSTFNTFIHRLHLRLQKPLPGKVAQVKMAPAHRIKDIVALNQYLLSRDSAVLLLLYPDEGSLYIPLIQRPVYNGPHSGQVSLPGGKTEKYDSGLEQTAIRESVEEIGIDVEKCTVIGQLTQLYIPPSYFRVQPFVAFSSVKPQFVTDKKEVEKLLEVNLIHLLDDANLSIQSFFFKSGVTFEAPCFKVNNTIIWGATAMILSEFLTAIREC